MKHKLKIYLYHIRGENGVRQATAQYHGVSEKRRLTSEKYNGKQKQWADLKLLM